MTDAVLSEAIRIADEILGVRVDEKGSYYMEEILLKRVLEGPSQTGICEECDGNVAQSWIDSEDVYESGDDGPPFHPNCVCEEEYKTSTRRVYV